MKYEYYIIDPELGCCKSNDDEFKDKTLILFYLYYEDSYLKYIDTIISLSAEYTVCVITASEKIRLLIDEAIKNAEVDVAVMLKENRGRDVAALLVTAKNINLEYEYLCFFHDKASKNEQMSLFVSDWEATLFKNTLSSKEYVRQVLNTFESNKALGLLLPPEPMGDYHYFDYWLENYENTIKLAEELELDVKIDRNVPPLSVGTVFWCRTNALKNLFLRNWDYQDFPEEPLANDGTISHAVERILEFVSVSNGYSNGIVINKAYAALQLGSDKREIIAASKILEQHFGIMIGRQLFDFEDKVKEIKLLSQRTEALYIYGAGMIGKKCADRLNSLNILFDGYVVTNKSINEVEGKKVFAIDETLEKKAGYIIAVSVPIVNAIKDELRKRDIFNFIVFL